jgi:hypothetical protein
VATFDDCLENKYKFEIWQQIRNYCDSLATINFSTNSGFLK